MKIGLALGSGSARGWSHIGVIRALAEKGIEPDIVCGASIGALVGASYVLDNLEKLERWVRSLSKLDIARFLDINASLNGFVNTEKLHKFLNEYVADDDALIESANKQFAAVATDLETGREIWITRGSVLEAVWSSISLPGLFPAIRNDDKWIVDGGLVNPVPVSVCRALGADIVIAVNLNGDIVGKHFRQPKRVTKKDTGEEQGIMEKLTDFVAEYTTSLFTDNKPEDQPPNLLEAIAGTINITQDRITRSRMAGDPPEILLSPKLSQIGLLEFYRASEAIEEGIKSVQRVQSELENLFEASHK